VEVEGIDHFEDGTLYRVRTGPVARRLPAWMCDRAMCSRMRDGAAGADLAALNGLRLLLDDVLGVGSEGRQEDAH